MRALFFHFRHFVFHSFILESIRLCFRIYWLNFQEYMRDEWWSLHLFRLMHASQKDFLPCFIFPLGKSILKDLRNSRIFSSEVLKLFRMTCKLMTSAEFRCGLTGLLLLIKNVCFKSIFTWCSLIYLLF